MGVPPSDHSFVRCVKPGFRPCGLRCSPRRKARLQPDTGSWKPSMGIQVLPQSKQNFNNRKLAIVSRRMRIIHQFPDFISLQLLRESRCQPMCWSCTAWRWRQTGFIGLLLLLVFGLDPAGFKDKNELITTPGA